MRVPAAEDAAALRSLTRPSPVATERAKLDLSKARRESRAIGHRAVET